jgi:hypothetical protein
MTEHRRRYDSMVDQVKKWWQIIVVIFILGGTWATSSYKVNELERRVEKLENFIDQIDYKGMQADIKDLRRMNRHG